MSNNKAREVNNPIIKQLIDETTPEELAKIDAGMTNNKINKLKNIIQLYTNTENMTNNKLAVEWLAKSYVDLLTKLNNEEISLKEFEIQYIELLEQAKEMEKRQIVDAWSNGFDEDDRATSNPFKYYNETYGDDK
jgi:hypothetical protein